MPTKQCSRCKLFKGIDRFSRDNSKRSGFHSWCLDCNAEQKRERYVTINGPRSSARNPLSPEILRRYEDGEKQCEIAYSLGLTRGVVAGIIDRWRKRTSFVPYQPPANPFPEPGRCLYIPFDPLKGSICCGARTPLGSAWCSYHRGFVYYKRDQP